MNKLKYLRNIVVRLIVQINELLTLSVSARKLIKQQFICETKFDKQNADFDGYKVQCSHIHNERHPDLVYSIA